MHIRKGVDNPVENVKQEKCQRKELPGQTINFFGVFHSVHEVRTAFWMGVRQAAGRRVLLKRIS